LVFSIHGLRGLKAGHVGVFHIGHDIQDNHRNQKRHPGGSEREARVGWCSIVCEEDYERGDKRGSAYMHLRGPEGMLGPPYRHDIQYNHRNQKARRRLRGKLGGDSSIMMA
jgi:hypothetical protein